MAAPLFRRLGLGSVLGFFAGVEQTARFGLLAIELKITTQLQQERVTLTPWPVRYRKICDAP